MKQKNIAISFPLSVFSDIQKQMLESLVKVTFIEGSKRPSKDVEVLVFDSNIPNAKSRLTELLDSLPEVKYLVLGSSDYSFVDLDYCKQRNIVISYVPRCDAMSKAEHAIALVFACSRRILLNDRNTYRRKYVPEPGFDVRGKTLGIIGTDTAVERISQLAKGIGLTIYTTDRFEESNRKPPESILSESDYLVLCLSSKEQCKKFLNKELIKKIKTGAIIINMGDRELVDEAEMHKQLLSRNIYTYCFQSEGMGSSPLKGNEFAIMLKPFATNTFETQEKNIEALTKNLEYLVRGMPYDKLVMV